MRYLTLTEDEKLHVYISVTLFFVFFLAALIYSIYDVGIGFMIVGFAGALHFQLMSQLK